MGRREFAQHSGQFAARIIVGTIEAVGTAGDAVNARRAPEPGQIDPEVIIEDSIGKLQAAGQSIRKVTSGAARGLGHFLLGEFEMFGGVTALTERAPSIFDVEKAPVNPDVLLDSGERHIEQGKRTFLKALHLD